MDRMSERERERERERLREVKTVPRDFACATGRMEWSATKMGTIMRGAGLGKELEFNFVHVKFAAPVKTSGYRVGYQFGSC